MIEIKINSLEIQFNEDVILKLEDLILNPRIKTSKKLRMLFMR